MPGLTLPSNLSAAILGAQQNLDPSNASVLDPWYISALRKLGTLMGADNPTAQVMLQPEMTTFLDNGVPNVAARKLATDKSTQALQKTIKKLNIPADQAQQMLAVAAQHPRVMAHVQDVYTPGLFERMVNGVSKSALGEQVSGPIAGRGEMALYQDPANEYANTFAHELTHAAQNVALKDSFTPEYNMADKVYGYNQNPFEVGANYAAMRKTSPTNPQLPQLQNLWQAVRGY